MSFFGFEAEPAEKPAKPAKPSQAESAPAAPSTAAPVAVAAEVAPATAAAPAPATSIPTDPEAMAQALAQHPDFRVLRRLQPVVDYGGLHGQPTQRVIVLDTETTGLDSRTESIIELAMLSVQVDTATGLPVGPVTVYESFEDPGKPIPAQITEITGIDDSMVKGLRIDDAAVAALVQQADLIVAHNAGFDRPFVEARLPVFATKPWNCSFAGIDWKKEGKGSAKLEFLASDRGWFYDAHRAQVDCHALLQVLSTPLGRSGPPAGRSRADPLQVAGCGGPVRVQRQAQGPGLPLGRRRPRLVVQPGLGRLARRRVRLVAGRGLWPAPRPRPTRSHGQHGAVFGAAGLADRPRAVGARPSGRCEGCRSPAPGAMVCGPRAPYRGEGAAPTSERWLRERHAKLG